METGRILHNDISVDNIVLSEDEKTGFLMGLDQAIEMNNYNASSGLGRTARTATTVFMAVGALEGKRPTFMHDLESFFWSLFCVCIHYQGLSRGKKVDEKWENWNFKDNMDLVNDKRGLASSDYTFGHRMGMCTNYCKPLVPYLYRYASVFFRMAYLGLERIWDYTQRCLKYSKMQKRSFVWLDARAHKLGLGKNIRRTLYDSLRIQGNVVR